MARVTLTARDGRDSYLTVLESLRGCMLIQYHRILQGRRTCTGDTYMYMGWEPAAPPGKGESRASGSIIAMIALIDMTGD
jgi:hypothetical protein